MEFELKVDLNALNHLGMNLYSNVPAVLSELIANSWDADSSEVSLDIFDDSNGEKTIVVKDNGCGMDEQEMQDKFLTVGYMRRPSVDHDLTKRGRKVMGRKGIGKLSVFSIAEDIQIYTCKNGCELGLRLETEKIQEDISQNRKHNPPRIQDIPSEYLFRPSGTTIVLSKLKKRVYSSLDLNLRKRIARRFNIWNDGFSVLIDDKTVTFEDRDYFHKLEFATVYGDYDRTRFNHLTNDHLQERDGELCNGTTHHVNGWIGLVRESGQLQENNENLNRLTILARGKVALEDILERFSEGGLYTKYLIGELEADFMDLTDQEDIATSSRQDFLQSDQRYIDLSSFVRKELKFLEKERKKYKEEEGRRKAEEIPVIKEWFDNLKGDAKNSAKKLFGRINTIATDMEHRKILYKHGILAFEYLHQKEMLSKLDRLDVNNLDSFTDIFLELDDIEASWYYQITRNRLDVITKLSKLVDKNSYEKVIQEIVCENLWLLDPSWDRATETPEMERTVKKIFDKISDKLTDEEKRGRFDILYKKTSGKHVIIELKRPGVMIKTSQMVDQVEKYRNALITQLEEMDELVDVDTICLIHGGFSDWGNNRRKREWINMLKQTNIRIVTYVQLIKEAEISYRNYLEKSKKKARIVKLLEEIDKLD